MDPQMYWELLADRGTLLIQQLINGLTLGGVYALIAVGYTMVYGIIGLINFAHGELYMLGAFLGLTFILMGLPWWVAFPLAIACCSLVGAGLERVAYRPLRGAPRLAALITAIGASIFLQNLALIIWGAQQKKYPTESMPSWQKADAFSFGVGGHEGAITFPVPWMNIIIVSTAAVLMVVLFVIIHRTRIGLGMRAIAQDRKAAALMGINVDKVVRFTFMLGSGLAAVAGIMMAMHYEKMEPYMGYHMGIKAFAAAVLGGIGSIPGAVVGGLVLGLGEAYGAGYLSSEYRDGIAYLILIGVIIFKPSGLMGKPLKEKV